MRKFTLISLVSLTLISMFYSCQTAENVQQDAYYVNGRDLYLKHCQNCHGAKGEGLGTLTPPLTDSIFMKANKEKLACIIKNGISTPVTVHGQVYEGKMPEFNLANIDVAQLVVYITNAFGHKQGMYTTQQIENDLKNCK
ncbi:cytochrome c [Pedobacter sp. PAMC26386]|nr:cytochrome c [Pedobacter sp. PAMC26386]